MKKILLTGKNGQVGWELQRTLSTLGEVIAVDRNTLNLANPDAVRRVMGEVKPAVIVNAAAYTAVDKAESEPEIAMSINGIAPGIMAEEAKKLGALVIHYSTDYVFDGAKEGPYVESDVPNPVNVYGKTKLAGEQAVQAAGCSHLIFRTSWVYGARGKNFLRTIQRLAKERDELKIVDDQVGAPTWSRAIAEATAQVLAQWISPVTGVSAASPAELSGVYHLTCSGATSWFGFAQAILARERDSGSRAILTPIPTTAYPLPATRPKNSLLDNGLLKMECGVALPDWRVALAMCLDETDMPG